MLQEDYQSIRQGFLDHLRYERNASTHTIRNYQSDLNQFFGYLKSLNLRDSADQISQITNVTIRTWLAELHSQRKQKSSIARKVSTLRTFFQFLVRESIIQANPAQLVTPPRSQKRLPAPLSIDDVNRLIEIPCAQTPIGKRDRAILELLYATGITVSELISLNLLDLDLKSNLLQVMSRHSNKRIVPFHGSASKALLEYLFVRTNFIKDQTPSTDNSHALILSYQGTRMTARSIGRLVTKYARFTKNNRSQVNPRTLRHSFAAHMLDAGADLRELQQFLGHAQVKTTQKYCAISIDKLADIYTRTMPTLPLDHAQTTS